MIQMTILPSREEWLEHRSKYIGGSDAAAIIGQNPWKSNIELWLEKTGQAIAPDISDNPNVKFGINAEPIIREIAKLNYPQYEFFYEENNSFFNDKYPFASASLDGWLSEKATGRHGIHEIKTSEITSSMQKEKWNNQIPSNYYCQILHYFIVREDCEFALLTALLTWRMKDEEIYQQIKNYHIERSEVEEDIRYMLNAEIRFWKQVQERNKPGLILPEI